MFENSTKVFFYVLLLDFLNGKPEVTNKWLGVSASCVMLSEML